MLTSLGHAISAADIMCVDGTDNVVTSGGIYPVGMTTSDMQSSRYCAK